ncbi:MAG: O-antigen ligase family protein [Planctomycetes bacterium]|nr:O-antigen ligase family protein [Planctomycetota bacterium]
MAPGLIMRRVPLLAVALLLACPLFDWPDSGYDAIRLPLVLGLSAVLLGVVFLKAARGGERPPGPAPLRTAALLLLGAHLLSLIAARSIADAALPILILFAGVSVFSCLRAGVLRREAVDQLLPLIPIVGLVFAGIGIVQALTHHQAVSTEGNRNYAGAVASLLLPVTVAFTRTGPAWSRVLSGFSALNLGALLLLTESRGGLLAAVAGLLIAGAALWAKRVDRGAAVAGAAVLLVGGCFAGFQARAQLSPGRMETAGFRRDVWKSGGTMVAARPLLGWGAGGFAAAYPPFRSESELRYTHQ